MIKVVITSAAPANGVRRYAIAKLKTRIGYNSKIAPNFRALVLDCIDASDKESGRMYGMFSRSTHSP